MLNNKYFKRLMKLLRAYEHCLDGHRLIISPDQSEIKLSYKDDFNRDTETTWIAHNEHMFTDRISTETVYYSIEYFLSNKYPSVIFNK